jgi:transposase-like protein
MHRNGYRERSTRVSTGHPTERVNREIKRRADMIGILSNDEAAIRPVRALLPEQWDEWAARRARYTRLEPIAPKADGPVIRPPAGAP